MMRQSVDRARGNGALRILVAGAAKAVIEELRPDLEARAGRPLDTTFDTVGALRDRILRGEAADLAILSRQALDALAQRGIESHGVAELGRTGIGLAGRIAGAPASVDTPERFRDCLLSASSIGYADPDWGATAGAHFVRVIERLGLTDALQGSLRKFAFGVDAVGAVSRGEIDCAVSQATEILLQPNVRLVGLFPEPFALWTDYVALALSRQAEAQALLEALRGSAVASSLRRVGFA